MKAILHTGISLDWVPDPDRRPWGLLPVGNRPVLEYWLEACVSLGIRGVRIVLGEGADLIEAYAGEGEKWGLQITYSFQVPGEAPDAFPRRSPEQWRGDGLLFLCAPAFPLRSETPPRLPDHATSVWKLNDNPVGFLTTDPAALDAFLNSKSPPLSSAPDCGIQASSLDTAKDYFDLNMRMVDGEIRNYLAPGYSLKEDSCVGFNVVIPPSTRLQPPLMIGNNCRFQPLTVLGPGAVIGNQVVVDSQTELSSCVVLDGTYLGKNLEFQGKILAGRHLIDPESGVVLELEDPLLLGQVGAVDVLRENLRALAGKVPALLLFLAQAPFFLFGCLLLRLGGGGAFTNKQVLDRRGHPLRIPAFSGKPGHPLAALFQALSLDRWPLIPFAIFGPLALCGHLPLPAEESDSLRRSLPRLVPGVYADELLLPQPVPPLLREVYARNYLHSRSLSGDLALLFRVLFRRLLCTWPPEPAGVSEDGN